MTPRARGGLLTQTNMPAFRMWPAESGIIIARLLGGYGEQEFELALCLGHSISHKRKAYAIFFAALADA